jgi:succinate-acetate transporter protein
VTAALSLGWLPVSESRGAYLILLTFVVPIQGVAAVFAFLSRDTAGGTILSLFGATWAALAVSGLTSPPGSTSSAVGTFLVADAVAIALLALAALVGNPAFTVILAVSCARFMLNGVYELTGSTHIERIAGGVGLFLCATAAYAGIAFLLEDAAQHPVLPMLRHGPSRRTIESSFADELGRLEREPGVRARL